MQYILTQNEFDELKKQHMKEISDINLSRKYLESIIKGTQHYLKLKQYDIASEFITLNYGHYVAEHLQGDK